MFDEISSKLNKCWDLFRETESLFHTLRPLRRTRTVIKWKHKGWSYEWDEDITVYHWVRVYRHWSEITPSELCQNYLVYPENLEALKKVIPSKKFEA